MRVGIIGGGFSGLMAAYRLSQKNSSCMVFEERWRLGGRFDHAVKGMTPSLHPEFSKLIEELGIELSLEPLGGEKMGILTPEGIISMTEANLEKMTESFSSKDREMFQRMKEDAMKMEIDPFDISKTDELRNMTMEDYLKGCSEEFIKNFVYILLNLTFMYPVDISRVSAMDGLFHLRVALEFSGPEAKTFGKDEGIEIITSVLEKKLRDKDVELNTLSRVEGIEEKNGKRVIHFKKEGKEFSEEVDKVLITVPAGRIKEIDPELDAGEGIFYEKTKCVYLNGERKTDKRIILGSPTHNPSNIRLYFDTHHEEQEIFPMDLEKEIDFSVLYEDYEIISESERIFSYPAYAKGARAPKIKTDKKGVYLAGDYFYFPIMETALRTVELAVEMMTKKD